MVSLHKNRVIITFTVIVFGILLTFKIYHNKQEWNNFILNYDKYNNETDYFTDTNTKPMDKVKLASHIQTLRNKMNQYNRRQIIQNKKLNEIANISLVIVTQVHNRTAYLSELIKSLGKVRGIAKTLLVFSHDFFSKGINEVIQRIHFAPFVQIFYPYNSQIHPTMFPGDDPKYCTDGWKCVKSDKQRNSQLAQVKNHWWWKVNYVFEHLNALDKYNGYILFLEDDQYVTEDLIYAEKLLERLVAYECPECLLISVGAERPQLSNYHLTIGNIRIDEFGTTPHDMGIAFNRTAWKIFKKLRYHFCHFNDSNWAISLRYLGTKLPKKKLSMLSLAGPRVFHIGKCSFLDSQTDCDISEKVSALKKFLKLVNKRLFPKNYVLDREERAYEEMKAHGTFSDIRDKELCMYYTMNIDLGF